MHADRARRLLARERQRIEEGLHAVAPTETDEASDLAENELDEGLSDKLHVELAAVERAEKRFDAGTYGLSIESGEPIPDERLEAMPAAERTAEEQARFERGG